MNIKYLGHASFFIKSKDAKIVTDPYADSIGMKFPKQEADIVTISHDHGDHNNIAGLTLAPDALVVDWPGEYEKSGVRIKGVAGYHDDQKGELRGVNTLFRIETEGIRILHCGDLGHMPTESMLDQIGDVDILMIPVGGIYTIDAKQACQAISKFEPLVVIPMHYKTTEHDPQTFGELTDIDVFLKEYGAVDVQRTDLLTIKKEDLNEERKVIVLTS